MKIHQALFAAGCFWGVQYYFDRVPGVTGTTVGYTGGHVAKPLYDQVITHTTGHAEAVLVLFDSEKVAYETLVKHFFHMHDPTQLNRQGPDVGDNYRSEIFYFDKTQQKVAEKVLSLVQTSIKEPIVTRLSPAGPFYDAEPYHQKFTDRTGIGACHIPYRPL